jgi:hypothetical protein
VAGLLRAEVVADGRLTDAAGLLEGADATALLDDDGAPDPEKVRAAVSQLLARKPPDYRVRSAIPMIGLLVIR